MVVIAMFICRATRSEGFVNVVDCMCYREAQTDVCHGWVAAVEMVEEVGQLAVESP